MRGSTERPSAMLRLAGGREPRHLALINENRWRAQRYGTDNGLIHFATGRVASLEVILDDVLEAIHADAEYFDCVAEVEHARTILKRGTSADRQVACYRRLREQGVAKDQALVGVVDQLMSETVSGVRYAAPKSLAPRTSDALQLTA
jgi:glutamate---cysteine ligase / carboxylate-amine ligase